MKGVRLVLVMLFILVLCLGTISAAPQRKVKIDKILRNLQAENRIEVRQYVKNAEWTWVEVDYYDEQYPLTIDLLFSNEDDPSRVAYLVAPCGYNFRSNYFTPPSRNIAHFMRANDYLVVGITFREDHLPLNQVDQSVLSWGLAKHRSDMHEVIAAIQHEIQLPYELLGQSSAAVCVLDYAARYRDPKFKKITILDTDSFDPALQPEKVAYANMTYDAVNALIGQGIYANPFVKSFKDLIFAAFLYPDLDSGQARPYNLPGNFTFNGLLHFSLIYTAFLPGLYTPITGLPGEWVMVQGASAGYYNFQLDPRADDFALLQTDAGILPQAAGQFGEGTTPIAIDRDIYALLSLNGAYTIDWKGIQEKVVMINGQLSSGNQTYYGTRIREAGNTDVSIHIIPGYGYADLLYGTNAERDVWTYFLE
ncbi:MAG: hypothetical protein ACM3X6_14325 [Patescibacteria group bacterium]